MSSLNLVYGDSYKSDSINDQRNQLINIFANNIANKELTYSINNCKLWTDNNIQSDIITQLITKVQELNQYVRLTHVNKKSKYINMFPTLLEDPVEYFILTDLKEGVFYSLYITPDKINVL